MKNYAYAKEVLSEINKSLKYQMVAASFSFTSSHLLPEEQKYMQLVRWIQTEYSSFIKDILYYIPLAEAMASRIWAVDGLYAVPIQLFAGAGRRICCFRSRHTTCYGYRPSDNIGEELERIVEERLTRRTSLYYMKSDLAEATHQLIIYEEQHINAILYKSMREIYWHKLKYNSIFYFSIKNKYNFIFNTDKRVF